MQVCVTSAAPSTHRLRVVLAVTWLSWLLLLTLLPQGAASVTGSGNQRARLRVLPPRSSRFTRTLKADTLSHFWVCPWRPTLYHCTSCATSNWPLRVPRLTRLPENLGCGCRVWLTKVSEAGSGPSLVSLASPPHPALLLVPSLSPPCPLPCSCCQCLVSGTILGTEQRPANSRGREAEKEQVTSGKRASERGDGRGAAGPGRVEGGLSAGDSGGGGHAGGTSRTSTQPAGPDSAEPWPLPGPTDKGRTRPPEAAGTMAQSPSGCPPD